jgi:SAM-dependent methyltransferase
VERGAAFDRDRYWIGRHERYRGDPRSVGNLGRPVEEKRRAEGLLRARVGAAARLLRPWRSVLDVGCGYGRVAPAFIDAGYEYVGVDVSPVAIEAARALEPRGSYRVGSALEIELDRRFDLVCVLYVFVHFVDDGDWRRLLAKLAGLVEEGGGLLFADDFPQRVQRPAPHVAQRPLRAYRDRLRPLGMRLDRRFPGQLAAAVGRDGREALPFRLARKAAGT